MSSSFYSLVFLLLISQIQAVPAPGPDSQGRNLVQFAHMIHDTLKVSPLDYNGYGCWCGKGGKGTPVDDTDACCQAHDRCYDAIIDSRANMFSCSPYFSIYKWKLDAKTGLPICEDHKNSCAHQVCECDRIVTECYKKHVQTFNKSLKCHI